MTVACGLGLWTVDASKLMPAGFWPCHLKSFVLVIMFRWWNNCSAVMIAEHVLPILARETATCIWGWSVQTVHELEHHDI